MNHAICDNHDNRIISGHLCGTPATVTLTIIYTTTLNGIR
mgnify:CR=1 FL=1